MQKRLNIKNAEAHDIAKELAQKDGITITQAVLETLRWREQQLADIAKEKAA